MKRRSLLVLGLVVPLAGCTGNSVHIACYMPAEFSPYEVAAVAKDLTTGQVLVDEKHPVAKAEFDRFLVYETGHSVELTVTLAASKGGSTTGYIRLNNKRVNAERRSKFSATITTQGS
jgi:hypothetical protein